jgi:hypothetical protein
MLGQHADHQVVLDAPLSPESRRFNMAFQLSSPTPSSAWREEASKRFFLPMINTD